jgi:hypothetical protein
VFFVCFLTITTEAPSSLQFSSHVRHGSPLKSDEPVFC